MGLTFIVWQACNPIVLLALDRHVSCAACMRFLDIFLVEVGFSVRFMKCCRAFGSVHCTESGVYKHIRAPEP